MNTKNLAMAMAAGCAINAAALADVTFRMVADQDLAVLSDGANNPTFFIGNNPSVCALVGDNLFVAGYRNNTSGTGVFASCQMVKIENIFGARAFRLVPDSLVTTMPGLRGFYGLQYDYGPSRAGLVLNYDAGSIGTAGAFKLFDVDTQLNPILVATSPAGTSARGGAGPAFDYGANGQGFGSGPVLSLLDFSNYGGVQARGPFGVQVTGDFKLDVVQGRVYDGNSIDGNNNPIAPVINGGGLSGTIWRDISIDPRNGNLAARSSNDVVIARRDAFNGVASKVVVSCDTGTTCDDLPFAILQRTELLWGSAAGDIVIYNRQASGTNFSDIVLAADLDGNPVPLTFKDLDGTPFSVTSAPGYFDFSWDGVNGRLAVLDFANRYAYIFEVETTPTCGPCFADYNQDGGVDGGDIEAFFTDWESSAGCSDANLDGGVDGGDIEAFFTQWEAGGC
jgi:hypothetical protein